ncbi:MAG TPA: protein phosphatase 2C domain-containing protein [Longimicrobiaceae bacterium]
MNFFHCRSAATTVQGRRLRNEDAVLDLKLPDGRHVVAVADGMGGHQSGEIASALALEVLTRELRAGARLKEAVIASNQAVYEEALRDPTRAGMGTTLVALLRTDAVYEIANVGDSRAYRIDTHGIKRISRDHSFAEEAASKSLMGPEEIARSPWRNALTRSIGTQESVEVDLFGPFEISGSAHTVLLCSDGLYRALSDDAAWHHLIAAPDPASGARILIDQALRLGSDDNVSVAVVQFSGTASPLQPGWIGSTMGQMRGRAQAPRVLPSASLTAGPESQIVAGSRRSSSRRTDLRRIMKFILSENVLFGLCTGILVMWLALRLLAS